MALKDLDRLLHEAPPRDLDGTDFAPRAQRLITERQKTHGSFNENARISQSLKENFRSSPNWGKLTDIEREAMDMIALKFSRILSGKSMEKQHWEDVVGYAALVEGQCE